MFSVAFSKEEHAAPKWASGFVIEDYIRELDELYKDRSNIRIPIPLAMEYCTEKLKGTMTKPRLEGYLQIIKNGVKDMK